MAEFVTLMKERERMCKTFDTHPGFCDNCPISHNNGYESTCCLFVCEHPEEAEKIIMEWAAEHPVETMKDRFFKMFPNAPKANDDNPIGCTIHLGWTKACQGDCGDCWQHPYIESEVIR